MNTTQNYGQNAMNVAMHAAQILKDAVDTAQEVADTNPPLHEIVIRSDLLGHVLCFFAESQDRDQPGMISFWDGKKGSGVHLAPIEYYHASKPVSQDETEKIVAAFCKEFNVKSFKLRKRLIKATVLNRDENGKVDKSDIEIMKAKLIAGITKVIMDL